MSTLHELPDDFLCGVAGVYLWRWSPDNLAIFVNSDRNARIFLRSFIEYFDFSNYATKAGVRVFYPEAFLFSAVFAPLF